MEISVVGPGGAKSAGRKTRGEKISSQAVEENGADKQEKPDRKRKKVSN